MKTFFETSGGTALVAAGAKTEDIVISAAVHGLYPEADFDAKKWWW
jgi:hypothetical protein